MKKTLFYNFLPTKAEEEAAAARNVQYQVTRTLVEIRDLVPHRIDHSNPWHIRKQLTSNEVVSGKLVLSHEDMFEHVFRYWNLDMANHVVQGNKCFVILMDYTDHDNSARRFQGENVYVKNGPNETYFLAFTDVIRSRLLSPGDEIGLSWDVRMGTFSFKLFRRGNSIS